MQRCPAGGQHSSFALKGLILQPQVFKHVCGSASVCEPHAALQRASHLHSRMICRLSLPSINHGTNLFSQCCADSQSFWFQRGCTRRPCVCMYACGHIRAYACDGGWPWVGLTAHGLWTVNIGHGDGISIRDGWSWRTVAPHRDESSSVWGKLVWKLSCPQMSVKYIQKKWWK